jgi:hypothetical protein
MHVVHSTGGLRINLGEVAEQGPTTQTWPLKSGAGFFRGGTQRRIRSALASATHLYRLGRAQYSAQQQQFSALAAQQQAAAAQTAAQVDDRERARNLRE